MKPSPSTDPEILQLALQESNSKLEAIYENAIDGIALLTDKGIIIDCNKRAEEYFGRNKDELIGQTPLAFTPPRQPDGEDSFDKGRNYLMAALNGEHQSFEFLHVHPNGEQLFLEVNLTKVMFNSQPHICGNFRDVTQLKKNLLEIKKLKKQLEEENFYLKEELYQSYSHDHIITQNKDFENVLNSLEQVARTDATVLILGETGTGKELMARAIHSSSPRNEKPLIKLNCAAIPANLIESELFGHEKGAFTGAISKKIGRFEMANGGTLFLDEVGEMPLELQSKLLRVLQEGEFERLGGTKTHHVDVRIISATNRELEQEIEKGSFRSDLYYRLNVFPLNIPPLRNRKDDIPVLTDFIINKYNKRFGKQVKGLSTLALKKLVNYNWPGNIRELENVIERSIIITTSNTLSLDDWQAKNKPTQDNKLVTLDEFERAYITRVLESTNWKVSGESGASEILGMKNSTLVSRMQKLGIKRP